jgi:putative thioredoxin
MSQWIFDTSDRDFERDVVERSREVPVVVDFWATWCGPCKTLGPVLEKLAIEHGGAFVLAKVDVDRSPQVAAALGIRSVPAVLGLRNGKIVAEFVGAVAEETVRAFLTRVLPSEAEVLAGEGHKQYAAGRTDEAERTFRRALELDARCDGALLGLARILADREEDEEALAILEHVLPGSSKRQEAEHLAASIRVGRSGPVDAREFRARVQANPNDLAARMALGQELAAEGDYEGALGQYIEVVKRDRAYDDEAARKAMLDVFELLGPGDVTAERYRNELAKVLFS